MPKTKVQLLQDGIDKLERTIVTKADQAAGFSGESNCVRSLITTLKFHDKSNSGFIFYPDFKDFMLRFNIVGGPKEMEELFNRYDVDLVGYVDYRLMASEMCGLGSYTRPNSKQSKTLEGLRHQLACKGAQGFVEFSRHASDLHRRLANREGFVYLDDVLTSLAGHFRRVDPDDLCNLLNCFTFQDKDHVNLLAFLRVLKMGMELYRKKLVRAVFDKLDPGQRGAVAVGALKAHSRVPSLPGQHLALDKDSMLAYMQNADVFLPANVAEVAWPAFLDYYRCLSLHFDSDRDFEELLRASWCIPGDQSESEDLIVGFSVTQTLSLTKAGGCTVGSPTKNDLLSPVSPLTRRVLVERGDGTEEIVDVREVIGSEAVSPDRVTRELRARGFQDIAAVKFY